MSLPRYPEYKGSGVEWLGEVPGHWVELPLKAVASHNDDVMGETTDADQEILYVDISSVDRAVGIVAKEAMPFAAAPSRARRKVKNGDVIVSTVRTYLRAIARIVEPEENLVVSTGFAVIRPTVQISHGFLGHLLSANFFVDEVIAKSVGVSYPAINASDLVGIKVPVPPIEEQQTIAAFLDRETGKIDALIAEQQRLVELLAEKRQAVISHAVTKGLYTLSPTPLPQAGEGLNLPSPTSGRGVGGEGAVPMKDSGIEWLGEVPEHWEVMRLGTLFREVSDAGEADRPILSVSIHDGISDRELDDKELDRKVTRSEDREKYKSVEPGDLVYNMMRAWQGGFGTVKVMGMVSPAYVVARPCGCFETEFIEQQLRSPQAVEEMRRHSRGVTDFRLRLYWDEFKSISIALAPKEEQADILAFLNNETAKFDTLTTEANRAIALLQERRSALISAAVTGKIDVRGLASA